MTEPDPREGRQRLTVVQMLPALESGGVERGTLEVGRYLAERGHRSIVVSAGGRLVGQLEREGSEHLAWDVGRKSLLTPLRYVGRLRRFLAAEGVDILHLRSRMPAWVGYWAWKGMPPARRPHLVTTVHGPYSVNRYGSVMVRGERVIAISNMIVEYIRRHYPQVPETDIRLIPRGVDPQQFPHGFLPAPEWLARWREQFPRLAGRKLVVLPARITRWKGQVDFVQVMAGLVAAGCDVHGLVVGEAHPRRREFLDELHALCEAKGLAERITFTGHRGDIKEIMAISDVVLSLSREPEAFGRVTLEALSLGRPVIAYDHGGVSEQMAALLPEGAVPVGDVPGVVRLLSAWLDHPPAVSDNNPFTLERMLSATFDVYRELAHP